MQFPASSTLAFLQNFGWQELLLIFLALLLLFGAKRLPELARGMGKSLKEFKKATSEAENTFKEAMKEEPEKAPEPKQPETNISSPESKN